jgi:hypothetical protein
MNEITATNSGLGNETGKIEFPPNFPEAQKKVIEAMQLGLNISAAARAGGVHRTTVMRWIDDGGEFRDVLYREEGKKMKNAQRQGKAIACRAADTVVHAIQTGDVGAALALLKELGVFEPMEETATPAGKEPVREEAAAAPVVAEPGSPSATETNESTVTP